MFSLLTYLSLGLLLLVHVSALSIGRVRSYSSNDGSCTTSPGEANFIPETSCALFRTNNITAFINMTSTQVFGVETLCESSDVLRLVSNETEVVNNMCDGDSGARTDYVCLRLELNGVPFVDQSYECFRLSSAPTLSPENSPTASPHPIK